MWFKKQKNELLITQLEEHKGSVRKFTILVRGIKYVVSASLIFSLIKGKSIPFDKKDVCLAVDDIASVDETRLDQGDLLFLKQLQDIEMNG